MISFEKWHGNGNDFVIINSIEQEIKLKKSFIVKKAKIIDTRNPIIRTVKLKDASKSLEYM